MTIPRMSLLDASVVVAAALVIIVTGDSLGVHFVLGYAVGKLTWRWGVPVGVATALAASLLLSAVLAVIASPQ